MNPFQIAANAIKGVRALGKAAGMCECCRIRVPDPSLACMSCSVSLCPHCIEGISERLENINSRLRRIGEPQLYKKICPVCKELWSY